jgi:lysozyme family protein
MADIFADLKDEYTALWSQMAIRPERMAELRHSAGKLVDNQPRYQAIETASGVPWFVIALIHDLEASRRFDEHLHNGDPLTARTVNVPAGRPPNGNPPFTWEQSAADALVFDKMTGIAPWTIERVAFELERYNGFGYRDFHPQVKSPYLWSFTNIYTCGKYTADNVWSDTAVSGQCGAMALLHAMIDQGAVTVPLEGTAPAPEPLPVPTGPPAPLYPGVYLHSGTEDDPNVKLVQQRLKTLGIDPGPIDSDFGPQTKQAVQLFQARSADETGQPLEIDGIVGPKTWGALFTPGKTPLPAPPPPATGFVGALLDIASEEVGVLEQPLGSNRGPRVDQYIRSVGLDPTQDSYPWCMCFVYWCHLQAAQRLNVPNLAPKDGSVHSAWMKSLNKPGITTVPSADAMANPALVRPGMVFFIDTGNSHGHAGIVVDNVNSYLETIEGNTNDNGSSEGIGVFRRTRRRIADISIGFAAYSA